MGWLRSVLRRGANMATYRQPKEAPAAALDKKDVGYPNNIPKTNTKTMRGAGAAIKGKGFSKNSQ